MTISRSSQFVPCTTVYLMLCTALPFVFGGRAAAADRDFYVSPAGDDANRGSESEPFATLARARNAVRELRLAENPVGPVDVYPRGGMHEIAEKLVFGPEDSGTAASPVTYRSYPGERAVLSGGRRLTGTWRQSPGKPQPVQLTEHILVSRVVRLCSAGGNSDCPERRDKNSSAECPVYRLYVA